MASSAAVVVKVPQRISRIVLDQIRSGPKTRREIYDAVRNDIRSMNHLRESLRYLHGKKRVVVRVCL
jgi:hypothetical protein